MQIPNQQMKIITGMIRLCILILVSYGMLYNAYKFYTPFVSGANDYFQYYNMYKAPLDFSVAESPFIFRQLSAILTHLIYTTGIFYANEISFNDPNYDQRIFFAAILGNYLCLILTAWLSGTAVNILTNKQDILHSTLAGLFCILSFQAGSYVLTGLTEGASWLLVAIGFIFFLQRKLKSLTIILILAIAQREVIIIVFFIMALSFLIFEKENSKFYSAVVTCSILCFIGYIAMRELSSIPGHEYQTDPQNLFFHLSTFELNRDIIFQGLFTQNLLALYLCTTLITFFIKQKKLHLSWFLSLTFTVVTLCIIGMAAGIGGNIGRICGILVPILACLTSISIFDIEKCIIATKNIS